MPTQQQNECDCNIVCKKIKKFWRSNNFSKIIILIVDLDIASGFPDKRLNLQAKSQRGFGNLKIIDFRDFEISKSTVRFLLSDPCVNFEIRCE